ncbi:hypothetical protein TNCV_3967821 [Trichonephila clavipes]|nr:hypothetical protein TNCV_3967821 [Trichonephila clavipes]
MGRDSITAKETEKHLKLVLVVRELLLTTTYARLTSQIDHLTGTSAHAPQRPWSRILSWAHQETRTTPELEPLSKLPQHAKGKTLGLDRFNVHQTQSTAGLQWH